MQPQILITADGSHTLFNKALNETYHSVNGALQESMHVFIHAGLHFLMQQNPSLKQVSILEIGFGTGLNAILTLKEHMAKLPIFYDALETFPLSNETIKLLNYNSFLSVEESSLFEKMHAAKWNQAEPITTDFTLHKIQQSALDFEPEEKYNLIYFDAFGPDKQPEMWSEAVFNKMYKALIKGGILVTYAAKGEVKRNMRSAGFEVTRLSGPPGKRHMVRGKK